MGGADYHPNLQWSSHKTTYATLHALICCIELILRTFF